MSDTNVPSTDDTERFEFECENGHRFGGESAYPCPYCDTPRVYVVTEVGGRVPV